MTPLRGREAELARLDTLAASALQGAGGVAVVAGAPGIGKSRLLAEAARHAASAGLVVAAGGADELDQMTSWGLLLRALSSSDPPIMTPADLDSLRELTDQRLAVAERMRLALEQAAASRPLLVMLDDLQWADSASLLALASLPGALFSYPVGWLLALRPLPASPALNAVLGRLEQAGAVRLRLGPLAAADALALARDVGLTGTDEDLRPLIADAEGNPFYIAQLLRAAGPTDPRTGIARHLRLLSDDARRLLQVASVLGRQFTVAEVAAMTEQPASELTEAVAEALRAEMLAEAATGLAFRHDLLREAAYESLPVSARLALHRDAAEALRRTGASVVRVAAQLAIGARPGDTAAAATIGSAVTELAPSSPNAAADLAVRALEVAGDHEERGLELVRSAVLALGLAGRISEEREIGERFLATHRLPAEAEAELQLELRRPWVIDCFEAYPVPLPEHLVANPAIGGGVAATLTALDQMPKIWDGRGEEADLVLADAMDVVTAGGNAPEFEVVAELRVRTSLIRGRPGEALARAEAARQTARSLAGSYSSGLYEEMIVSSLAAGGQISAALAAMRPALASAHAAGRGALVFRYRRLRAAMLLSRGNLDDADAEARSVIDLPAELGYPNRVALPLAVIVETSLRRGNVAEAETMLASYAAGTRGFLPDLAWATALAADARGDVTAAARAVEPVRALLEAGNFFFAHQLHHRLPQLVSIARRAGQERSARAFAAAAATCAGQNPEVSALAAAAGHARALIEGDTALLRRAVEQAAAGEDRLLEAAVREDLGRALTRRQEAAGQLEAAYDFYLRTGAHRDAARVRSVLRTLGIRKQASGTAGPQGGWASLTRAEQAVVDLVAKGLTNREAAIELFLSPDTVNTHLRHAFGKLNIRSRVELARLAAEPTQLGLQRGPELPEDVGGPFGGLGHPVVPETLEPSDLGAQIGGHLPGQAVLVERVRAGQDHQPGALRRTVRVQPAGPGVGDRRPGQVQNAAAHGLVQRRPDRRGLGPGHAEQGEPAGRAGGAERRGRPGGGHPPLSGSGRLPDLLHLGNREIRVEGPGAVDHPAPRRYPQRGHGSQDEQGTPAMADQVHRTGYLPDRRGEPGRVGVLGGREPFRSRGSVPGQPQRHGIGVQQGQHRVPETFGLQGAMHVDSCHRLAIQADRSVAGFQRP
jgi:DNA-binding CsgD family transcriptional regulator